MIEIAKATSHSAQISESGLPFRVSILEDDPSISILLQHSLRSQGFLVHAYGTIAAAREGLRTDGTDLLICDRGLPDGDGVNLCHELKSDSSAFNRYVIMLTAEASAASVLEGFERGADDYVAKPVGMPELLARVRAGLRIVSLQKALIQSNRKLELVAGTDSLTGLQNRRAFQEKFEKSFEHAMRYQRPLSLLLLDLDHFKQVNDNYGHQAGDDVLFSIGSVISAHLRSSDTAARFGGEEFAIILPETHLLPAYQVAEKIRRAIEATSIGSDSVERLHATVSIGVASMPHSTFPDAPALLAAADRAMYRGKNRGRNRVEMERRTDPSRPMTAAFDKSQRVASL